MNRIAPPDYGGKYDEAIEWLKWFEKTLIAWRDGVPIVGAISRMVEYSRHEHTITYDASSRNWDKARRDDKARTMKWLPVGEALHDLTAVMERWLSIPVTNWDEHIKNVRICRRALEQNNPPAELPIKY